MGRNQLWHIVTLLPLLLCGAAVAPDSADSAVERATRVRIAQTHPLELHGEGFVPNEHVTLRIELGGKVVKRSLRASAKGTFVSRYGGLVLDRCSKRLEVKAVGARGSSAEFILQTLPCPNGAAR